MRRARRRRDQGEHRWRSASVARRLARRGRSCVMLVSSRSGDSCSCWRGQRAHLLLGQVARGARNGDDRVVLELRRVRVGAADDGAGLVLVGDAHGRGRVVCVGGGEAGLCSCELGAETSEMGRTRGERRGVVTPTLRSRGAITRPPRPPSQSFLLTLVRLLIASTSRRGEPRRPSRGAAETCDRRPARRAAARATTPGALLALALPAPIESSCNPCTASCPPYRRARSPRPAPSAAAAAAIRLTSFLTSPSGDIHRHMGNAICARRREGVRESQPSVSRRREQVRWKVVGRGRTSETRDAPCQQGARRRRRGRCSSA